jgi:hypothetical protein
MRLLTQASAEQWLARTGLTCLKVGRQGEPQVRTIKFNAADCSLFWNSDSKKKDPLLLNQVVRAFCCCFRVCAGDSGAGTELQHRPTIAAVRQVPAQVRALLAGRVAPSLMLCAGTRSWLA